ncbi:Protein of unknown function [Gryllus bimaculatus]|nr:Protein of unknown function [Gryllus bimaculatus]
MGLKEAAMAKGDGNREDTIVHDDGDRVKVTTKANRDSNRGHGVVNAGDDGYEIGDNGQRGNGVHGGGRGLDKETSTGDGGDAGYEIGGNGQRGNGVHGGGRGLAKETTTGAALYTRHHDSIHSNAVAYGGQPRAAVAQRERRQLRPVRGRQPCRVREREVPVGKSVREWQTVRVTVRDPRREDARTTLPPRGGRQAGFVLTVVTVDVPLQWRQDIQAGLFLSLQVVFLDRPILSWRREYWLMCRTVKRKGWATPEEKKWGDLEDA